MKTRALVVLVFPAFVTALPACLNDQSCPYGEVLVHDGSYDGVCMRRLSYTSPSATSKPAVDAGSGPPAATPASGTVGESDGSAVAPGPAPPTTSPPVAGTCGGQAAQRDSVRVVDKADVAPSFGDASPSLADGSYALVQATFFRTGSSGSPVRSLKATLGVRGPTLTVNARDTSITGLPDESLTFLLASPGVMTKTCESLHGSVSAWFFPFVVGGTTQPQMTYDGPSGFVRVVVTRADGATELVFAR